jgi:hypothetical protein
LIVIALNVAFLAVFDTRFRLASPGNPFADFAWSIVPSRFGLTVAVAACLALVLFYALALSPRRQSSETLHRLAVAVAVTTIFATGYVIATTLEARLVATGFIGVVWLMTWMTLATTARASPRHHSLWLRVPFGMLLALSTLVLLQSIPAAILTSRLARFQGDLAANWWIVAPAVAVLVGSVAALWLHDFVCPATLFAFLVSDVAVGTPNARLILCAAGILVVLSVFAITAVARQLRTSRHSPPRYSRQRA